MAHDDASPSPEDTDWIWTRRHRGSVHLWIKHFDFDADDLTRAFGLEPTRVWRRGQVRTSPAGRVLEGAAHRTESWFLDRDVPPGQWPSEVIVGLLPHLEAGADWLNRVWASGGTAAWVIHATAGEGRFVVGDHLDRTLLAALARLPIEVGFEVFGP